jgi:plasmid maintenance system killer protein
MEVLFPTRKDQQLYSSRAALVRRFGFEEADLMMRRLAQLRAADNLAIMGCLPPARCHQLVGDKRGQFSVDLKHPYRLVFAPVAPVPRLPDGGIALARVTAIVIIERVDYHG